MVNKKWVNRFTPIYEPAEDMQTLPLTLRIKIIDLYEHTVVEATGEKCSPYEEVRFTTEKGVITGWVQSADLEDYFENYPRDCVVISNQTPNPNDFEQYFMLDGIKQVNACGELCVAFILGISLQEMLENWRLKQPSFWKRVFAGGKARGTSSGELGEMFDIFAQENMELTTALFEPHIKRSRFTIKGIQRLLDAGSIIVSVNIDGVTGLLRGGGVLHWVVLTDVMPERNGLGLVQLYNPAMNRIEVYSWQEFINSAHQPYGIFAPDPPPPTPPTDLT